MGQYQQWLLAQEIDRRLKAEVETLETELLYLRDRIAILEQAAPQTENVILQALQAYLRGPASVGAQREQHGVEAGPSASFAQVHAGWSGLSTPETPRLPYSALPSPQMGLPAGDMLAFFDEREQINPRLPPAWLQLHSATETGGVDEETRRLNEDIQRWFERWHRESSSIARPEEVQDEL